MHDGHPSISAHCLLSKWRGSPKLALLQNQNFCPFSLIAKVKKLQKCVSMQNCCQKFVLTLFIDLNLTWNSFESKRPQLAILFGRHNTRRFLHWSIVTLMYRQSADPSTKELLKKDHLPNLSQPAFQFVQQNWSTIKGSPEGQWLSSMGHDVIKTI